MEWTISGEDLFVRIDPGEEIHASLQNLADEIGIDAAAITSGIGRTRENTYGFMNDEGVYITKSLNSPGELISLSGNISRTE
ncbi:MAG: PPC domain-containing DNA-binding protein, partial [Candidatus Thermoplasmatota archaeon]|nr:PPC domain-containing DNA-binding protein [Candidatus Thermoplasmatota archaeon]